MVSEALKIGEQIGDRGVALLLVPFERLHANCLQILGDGFFGGDFAWKGKRVLEKLFLDLDKIFPFDVKLWVKISKSIIPREKTSVRWSSSDQGRLRTCTWGFRNACRRSET